MSWDMTFGAGDTGLTNLGTGFNEYVAASQVANMDPEYSTGKSWFTVENSALDSMTPVASGTGAQSAGGFGSDFWKDLGSAAKDITGQYLRGKQQTQATQERSRQLVISSQAQAASARNMLPVYAIGGGLLLIVVMALARR